MGFPLTAFRILCNWCIKGVLEIQVKGQEVNANLLPSCLFPPYFHIRTRFPSHSCLPAHRTYIPDITRSSMSASHYTLRPETEDYKVIKVKDGWVHYCAIRLPREGQKKMGAFRAKFGEASPDESKVKEDMPFKCVRWYSGMYCQGERFVMA